MAGYLPYPEYKDSGVEWLGEVPKHWIVKKLKFFVTAYGGGTPNTNKPEYWGGNIPWVSPKDMKADVVTETEDYLTDLGVRDSSTQLVPIGSVLLVVRSGILRHSIPVSRNKVVVALNQDMKALITNDQLLSSYLQRLIQGNQKDFLHFWCKPGCTVESIEYGSVANTEIGIPAVEEQKIIARFLDHKTGQIDALIAKKQTLLEKLTEKRIALISHAVTKGLDPNVKMKDSGVTWLGQVPEHWDVKRLRFCVSTNPSKNEVKLNDDSAVSFVPMDAVGEYGSIRLEDEKELSEIGSGYTYFANDDVVVAKITPCFENGKGAIAAGLTNGVAFGTTELHIIRSGREIVPEYLFHITMSHPFRQIGEFEMYGAGGQKRIPEDFIKNFRIGIPPLAEQTEIVSYINKNNGLSQRQFNKAEEAIEKLKEYRTALIAQAVTGKIDVRNIKIPTTTAKGQAA